jgi:hypothetical protein
LVQPHFKQPQGDGRLKRSAYSLAWAFLGVLTVAAVLITVGKRENLADPRIDSYRPSGLSAFADLLRTNGYSVSANASPVPDLQTGDVAVVCIDEDHHESFDQDSSAVYKKLDSFASKGGRIILLPFNPSFAENSVGLSKRTLVSGVSNETRTIETRTDVSGDAAWSGLQRESSPPSAALWSTQGTEGETFATLMKHDKGTMLTVADGYIATNRFIDHEQNADVLMYLIATLAPTGGHIVFAEAVYTDTEPGLIELLGPGAAGIWYQSLFLFVVVVFTLGKRFGLPEEVRAIQTGQRELIDAVADTYRRARSTKVACRATYDRSDAEVRKAIKLSSEAPTSERDERIPAELASEFRNVFEGTIDNLKPDESFARCRALRLQVNRFLHRG